jgi:diadenosine tetraphosphate (Ap4A) HIT family hydrolase
MFNKRKYPLAFDTILVADKEHTVAQEDIPDEKLDSLYNIVNKYKDRVSKISDEFEEELKENGFDYGMSIIDLKGVINV